MSPNTQQELNPELLEALLENPHESLIVIDSDSVVRFVSEAGLEYRGLSKEQALGRPLAEVDPDSLLERVVKTGKAEIGRMYVMGGRQIVIARIPLKNAAGQVVGAAGKLLFWHPEQLQELIRQAQVLEGRLDYYEKELKQLYGRRYSLDRIIGQSEPMQRAKRVAAQAASSDLSVLITGETGTGKELFAHAIHQMSPRRDKPLVRVNCAAIPGELFEAELFGYEPGAFTGASRQGKPGRFELASGGTIFLDEVGELAPQMQAKLLRVIQERQVERLGGTKVLDLDFRVIAATNRDLEDMMKQGRFRQDLFYRLNIFRLFTPPLREISEDVPRLVYSLLAQIRSEAGRAPRRVHAGAMDQLMAHNWPGNVRELRNALERAAAQAGDGDLHAEDLPPELHQAERSIDKQPPPGTLRDAVERAERQAIQMALEACGGNRSRAAALLGVHRSGLYQKLAKYRL